MIRVEQLFIYPIKSLRGISIPQGIIEEKGFRYDRRLMLVSPDGFCLTQHRCPQMTRLEVALQGQDRLRVWHRSQPDDGLELPLVVPSDSSGSQKWVRVWDSQPMAAVGVSEQADRWFSRTLEIDCHLVFMPPSTHRPVDPAYARHQESVSFADGYPYLLIGQSSLDSLNQRLADPLSMLRFRPNIVVSGSQPYEEDTWRQFQIGPFLFYAGEACGRCLLTTLDPFSGQRGPEPLRTLATYRKQGTKILFGQYVFAEPVALDAAAPWTVTGESATLRVGQALEPIPYQAFEPLAS